MRNVTQIALLLFIAFLLTACGEEKASLNRIPVAVADVANIHHPNAQHFTSGQPTEAQLATFKELGVNHVVNLRSHEEMADVDAERWVDALGMNYYHLPVAGGGDLTRDNVAEFHRVMSNLEGEKALIHCASSNRVGAMTALRAAWFHGASKEDALAKGREYGMKSLEAQVEKLLSE